MVLDQPSSMHPALLLGATTGLKSLATSCNLERHMKGCPRLLLEAPAVAAAAAAAAQQAGLFSLSLDSFPAPKALLKDVFPSDCR